MSARVLVVDDHLGMQVALHALFEAEGYEVVGEASDGLEAMAAISADPPDLVVLDYVMPLMDGMKVLKRLSKEHPEIVVVVYTSDPDALRPALNAGAAAAVDKGHTGPEELVDLVGDLLE